MLEFIFMLTRDDVTLPDARAVYASVSGTGLRHVGSNSLGPQKHESHERLVPPVALR